MLTENAGPSGSGSDAMAGPMDAHNCHHDSDDSGDDDDTGRGVSSKSTQQQMDDFESAMLEEDANQMKELVFDYLRMKYTGHRNAR